MTSKEDIEQVREALYASQNVLREDLPPTADMDLPEELEEALDKAYGELTGAKDVADHYVEVNQR